MALGITRNQVEILKSGITRVNTGILESTQDCRFLNHADENSEFWTPLYDNTVYITSVPKDIRYFYYVISILIVSYHQLHKCLKGHIKPKVMYTGNSL